LLHFQNEFTLLWSQSKAKSITLSQALPKTNQLEIFNVLPSETQQAKHQLPELATYVFPSIMFSFTLHEAHVWPWGSLVWLRDRTAPQEQTNKTILKYLAQKQV